ncbi:MAG TPA: DUF4294 domain-containing protein [Bacteroidales bacterium]|nr:DUF4294 domain-containing protein [Bacteroidales bacterium]HPS73385.1 DUF4294 domain-containing protein [Bacteroidales bacterium]
MIRVIAIITGFMLLSGLPLIAQDVPDTVPARIINGDTVALIDLKAFMTFPSLQTPNRQVFRYDRLLINVKKVYPYAKLAGIKLAEYQRVLDTIPTEKGRKAFMKKAEKQLEAEFGPQIRDLTFSQGKVLIKLIYRQTGSSSFEIVKELRGRFNAFLWQTMAGLFGYDLKTGYDPGHDAQDQAIERIVLAIEDGTL